MHAEVSDTGRRWMVSSVFYWQRAFVQMPGAATKYEYWAMIHRRALIVSHFNKPCSFGESHLPGKSQSILTWALSLYVIFDSGELECLWFEEAALTEESKLRWNGSVTTKNYPCPHNSSGIQTFWWNQPSGYLLNSKKLRRCYTEMEWSRLWMAAWNYTAVVSF